MTAIVPLENAITVLSEVLSHEQLVLMASRSPSTWKAYAYEWRLFRAWCETRKLEPLNATSNDVSEYLMSSAKDGPPNIERKDGKRRSEPTPRKRAGIERALAALSQIFQLAGKENPTKAIIVRTTIKAIARLFREPQRRASAVRLDDLRKLYSVLPNGMRGYRDWACLTLGFWGGCRRSEIVGLDLEDVVLSKEGMVLRLKETKTTKTGEPEEKFYARAIDTLLCPVIALEEWLAAHPRDKKDEPLFVELRRNKPTPNRMSDMAIYRLIGRYAKLAGLEGRFTGHSLRAGIVTEGVLHGLSDRQIMQVTGHKSPQMIGTYTRRLKSFDNNVVNALLGKKGEKP